MSKIRDSYYRAESTASKKPPNNSRFYIIETEKRGNNGYSKKIPHIIWQGSIINVKLPPTRMSHGFIVHLLVYL